MIVITHGSSLRLRGTRQEAIQKKSHQSNGSHAPCLTHFAMKVIKCVSPEQEFLIIYVKIKTRIIENFIRGFPVYIHPDSGYPDIIIKPIADEESMEGIISREYFFDTLGISRCAFFQDYVFPISHIQSNEKTYIFNIYIHVKCKQDVRSWMIFITKCARPAALRRRREHKIPHQLRLMGED